MVQEMDERIAINFLKSTPKFTEEVLFQRLIFDEWPFFGDEPDLFWGRRKEPFGQLR